MTPDIEYDHREFPNEQGEIILYQAYASCKLCDWKMTEESYSALRHMDCIEYIEEQAINHAENHH